MRFLETMIRLWLTLVFCTSVSIFAETPEPIKNTATLLYSIGTTQTSLPSNTTQLFLQRPPTPAVVKFLRLVPNNNSAVLLPIDGGMCSNATSGMRPLAISATSANLSINPQAAPVLDTTVFHANEPIVISLSDQNRNTDPLIRETVEVNLKSSSGDQERLILNETGIDTGVFTSIIETSRPPQVPTDRDCKISVSQGAILTASYVDTFYPTDIAQANVLVDPYGIIFNSQTGEPINGARITIINIATGLPAQVFGDDGTSLYPSTVITGTRVTDSSGRIYDFPIGGYRFPFLNAGNYRFNVEAPKDFIVPSSVTSSALLQFRDSEGNPFVITAGSYLDDFNLNGPQALKIDIPADALPGKLALIKTSSIAQASSGDFVQYRLSVENRSNNAIARNLKIEDFLPDGFKYRKGTTRLNSKSTNDPVISNDGQKLSFLLESIAPSGRLELTYVTEIVQDFDRLEAVNRAIVKSGDTDASNQASVAVRINKSIFSDRFTLIGQVTEGDCSIKRSERVGVGNIRLFLDDGTYVTTDNDGRYHFEGVRVGTHVVQLDLASLPEELEILSCGKNSRWAGRSFSQFVEASSGALWRNDFYVKIKELAKPKFTISGKINTKNNVRELIINLGQSSDNNAKNIRLLLSIPKGISFDNNSIIGGTILSTNEDINSGILSLSVSDLAPGAASIIRLPYSPTALKCDASYLQLFATFDFGIKKSLRTPTLKIDPSCENAIPDKNNQIKEAILDLSTKDRKSTVVANTIEDDATAAGANTDWFADTNLKNGFVFPAETHNPRAAVVRAVVKHNVTQKIKLLINNRSVDPISYDGFIEQAVTGIAISAWRGIPLEDGENILTAIVEDKDGKEVSRYNQKIHYANIPAHATLVSERSKLVSDGLTPAIITVRITDRFGKPVRSGITGPIEINAPFLLTQNIIEKQLRQLSGNDSTRNTYHVTGDDGLAQIVLQPSSETGAVLLGFNFGNDRTRVREEVKTWITSKTRDWIVVGFAKGTIGHRTLTGKSESLPNNERGTVTDGSTSFYAKGRIKGDWLLTLAYDSNKQKGRTAQDRELLRTIDPNKYYTLYGDQTQQYYDAASLEKVYIRLEQKQFYALFGDYETGFNQTELGRYSRSFNGLKAEYRNENTQISAFGSKTQFNFARDELQGNGLATFYRLNRKQIIINSDKISLEVRDRFRSERIINTTLLTRHIDYDINYEDGSLIFREPIKSRDRDFNPVFIIADYETFGAAGTFINAGSRISHKVLSDKIELGLTGLYDESQQGKSKLGGLDIEAKITKNTLMRAEVARSTTSSNLSTGTKTGNAYIFEVEHRSDKTDALLYFKQQDPSFGLGQQNIGETGTQKYGADGHLRISDSWQLSGTAYKENYLGSDATRTAAQARIEYLTQTGTYFVGAQFASDIIPTQSALKSTLLSAGVSQFFFDRKLEVQVQSDIAISDRAENVDFPNRYRVGAAYKIRDDIRIIGAYEISKGAALDSKTAQIGFDIQPWRGAKITSTLNQARISEFGPRTYAQFGTNQAFVINQNFSVNFSGETNYTFNKSTTRLNQLNPQQPLASGGALGDRNSGASTIEDFWAISTGATYRHEAWSWTGRIEHRDGEVTNRTSVSTAVIRQTKSGIAVSGYGQYLDTNSRIGISTNRATLGVAFAIRPLGSDWSVLNKFEYRSDYTNLAKGVSAILAPSISFNETIKSRRLVNNFALNYFGEGAESDHNVWESRAQFSVNYNSKYVLDQFNNLGITGYSDFFGIEIRKAIGKRLDIGLQAGVSNNWSAGTRTYTLGPQIGVSPFENTWISVGYNFDGFRDRDFEAAHTTSKGPYITFRIKFDQLTAASLFNR
jgi:uncharacterized repeat protein (TIGR01451 family)